MLARAEPSPDWSVKAGCDEYEHTPPRQKGASTARRHRAKQWREAAHSQHQEGGVSSSSIEVGRRWEW